MSENSTSNQKSELSQVGSWMGHHWVMIVMIIVGGLLVMGLIKFFISLFGGGNGPIAKGVADVLTAAANALNALTIGCGKQGNCKFSDQKSCETGTGCGWSADDSGNSTCGITSGLSEGEGGVFTKYCGLGMFALGGFLLTALPGIFTILFAIGNALKSGSSKAIDFLAELTGGSKKDISIELTKKSIERSEKLVEQLEKTGEKLTPAEKSYLGRSTAIDELKKSLTIETDKIPDKAKQEDAISKGNVEIQKDVDKRDAQAEIDKMSSDSKDRIDNAVDGK